MSTSDLAFDLLRNHIIGYGYRAKRHAPMTRPGSKANTTPFTSLPRTGRSPSTSLARQPTPYP